MNDLRKKDGILKRFTKAFETSSLLLEEMDFKKKWIGFGGRDDDYIQFNFENKDLKIELNILFWISIYEFNEDNVTITFSCFRKVKENEAEHFFTGKISIKDLYGESINQKMQSLITGTVQRQLKNSIHP